MMISVVIPVLNEAGNIPLLVPRLAEALKNVGAEYELIFVDDGSDDDSLVQLERLHRQNPRMKILSLSRNFGHQMALTAGMDRASGDAVILMDADLQHPPEVVGDLVEAWKQGFEIVYAIRNSSEQASWFKRASSQMFYRIFRWMTDVDLPANAADFRLLDRQVVRAFQNLRERSRFLRGLTGWVGYRSTKVTYTAPPRQSGRSKFTSSRMLHLALDGLVSFSIRPLVAAIYIGFALSLFGFFYGLFAVYARFCTHQTLPGWTSLLMLMTLIGGIQLIILGVIGGYIGKIYEEVKQRPLYLVRQELGFDSPAAPSVSP